MKISAALMFTGAVRSFFKTLVFIGLITLLAGFLYGALAVGVPYPDPTPTQAHAQAVASQRCDNVALVGFAQLIAGILGWAFTHFFLVKKPGTAAN